MTITIDLDTAIAVVQQLYPSAVDPLLGLELEATKGTNYRPYLVAAKFIITEYRQLVKADTVTFQYDIDKTVRGLLNRQKQLDVGDEANIPEGQSVDGMLTEICNICAESSSVGISIY